MFRKKREFKSSNKAIYTSTIKPTFCKFCKSTYQALHRNLEFWDPALQRFADEPKTAWSACPLCGKFNKVEFEEERHVLDIMIVTNCEEE